MGRYDSRLARLERMASSHPAMRESDVRFAPTEFLEAAIEAAESETGLPILKIHPFTLSTEAGTNLANAMLESGLEITWDWYKATVLHFLSLLFGGWKWWRIRMRLPVNGGLQ